jgi:hypothetical protein
MADLEQGRHRTAVAPSGTPLRAQNRQSVVDLALRLLTAREHRDAEADGVTMIAGRGSVADRLGYAGFGTIDQEQGPALAWVPYQPLGGVFAYQVGR